MNPSAARPLVGRPAPQKARPAPLTVVAAPTADDAERVRRLLDVELPKRIAKRADVFDATRGTLALFVDGVGSWTIRFGDHAKRDAITRDAGFEADCVAIFGLAGFLAIIAGRTDGQQPALIGDGRLLSRLGQVMVEPARGPLGARLQSSVRR